MDHKNQLKDANLKQPVDAKPKLQELPKSERRLSRWDPYKWYQVKNCSHQSYLLSEEDFVILDPDSVKVVSGKDLQKLDRKILDKLEKAKKIDIRALDYDPRMEYCVVNMTPNLITIKHISSEMGNFSLSGSETRRVNGKTLLHLDYLMLEGQGLIQIDPAKNGTVANSWYRVKNKSEQDLDFDKGLGVLKAGMVRIFSGEQLQEFDLQRVNEWETNGKIDIQELDIDPERDYTIRNTKKERITIQNIASPDKSFVVDGQASRKVSGKTLLSLDYLEKLNEDLIQIEEVSKWHANRWYRVKNFSDQDVCSLKGFVIINAHEARAISGRDLLGFDQKELNKLEGSEKLTIRELDCDPEKDYTIINLTTERITIKHNLLSGTEFFVPGSGSRKVNGKTLLHLDFLLWESQGLIQIDPLTPVKEELPSTAAESLMGLTMTLMFLFLAVSVPYALRSQEIGIWAVVGIILLVGFLILAKLYGSLVDRRKKEFNESLKSWLRLLPGIVLILGTGIGLPIVIINLYGGGLGPSVPLQRFLQTGFIAIASVLPAFLFYLFGRQQVAEQKENFYREAMLLDPNVWSYSEAKIKYEPLLNTVYDTGNSPFSIFLLVSSTALLVTGWTIAFAIGSDTESFFTPLGTPFILGFLGAYFFSINLIYRRYVRADLTPKTYAYITMRLITTFVLVWAVSTLPQFDSKNGNAYAALPALAFIVGIFPETALTLIQNFVNKLTAFIRVGDPNKFSLTKLEGMNLYDQARLMEEGIENIENLAHHNLMELIVRTRIPTARLVDMFDQAILYIHLGLEEGETKAASTRNLLKNIGVRTATDLIACREKIDRLSDPKYASLKEKLDIVVASLEDDEWLNYIRCWRENSSTRIKEPINDPYKFYVRATGIEDARLEKRKLASSSGGEGSVTRNPESLTQEREEARSDQNPQSPDSTKNETTVVQTAIASSTGTA